MAFLIGLGMTNAQNIKFGAKAGLNLSTLRWDSETQKNFDERVKEYEKDGDKLSKDLRFAYHIGAMAEVEFTNNIAVQAELLFSKQGMSEVREYKRGGETVTKESLFSLNYLNLPILAKYKIAGVGLEFGPQFSFLMTGRGYRYKNGEVREIEDENGKKQDYFDLTKDEYGIRSFDLGLAFGASYTYNNIYAGLRYNLGLLDLAKKRDDNDKSTLKNGVFQVSVGYFF